MQEKYGKDGLQVVGATRYYGFGTDFAEGKQKGKQVGRGESGKLGEAAELEIVEHFAKAFEVSYPIAIVPSAVSKNYAVFAIPAMFVIDRSGTVRGVATGLDHKHLEDLIVKLLAESPGKDDEDD